MIKIAEDKDLEVLACVAIKLWSSHTVDDLVDEFRGLMKGCNCVFFIAYVGDVAVGFSQCAKRLDYVEGCKTSPVGYLEGVYLDKDYRRQGIAGQLLAACEDWARGQGCREFASDCEADNLTSLDFHLASGFVEANRVICLTKML